MHAFWCCSARKSHSQPVTCGRIDRAFLERLQAPDQSCLQCQHRAQASLWARMRVSHQYQHSSSYSIESMCNQQAQGADFVRCCQHFDPCYRIVSVKADDNHSKGVLDLYVPCMANQLAQTCIEKVHLGMQLYVRHTLCCVLEIRFAPQGHIDLGSMHLSKASQWHLHSIPCTKIPLAHDLLTIE